MKKRYFFATTALSLMLSAPAFGGTWEGQDGGWKYKGDSGDYLSNQWVQDGECWYYMGHDGWMTTGWLQVDGIWYYLEPSGEMVSGQGKWIDGKEYRFQKSGAWMQAGGSQLGPGYQGDGGNVKGTWQNQSYIHPQIGFRIRKPEGYVTYEQDMKGFLGQGTDFNFAFGTPDRSVIVVGFTYNLDQMEGARLTSRQLTDMIKRLFTDEGIYKGAGNVTTVRLADYEYEKLPLYPDDSMCQDVYIRQVNENQIFMFQVMYLTQRSGDAQALLNEIW